jgi:hypothetical protein
MTKALQLAAIIATLASAAAADIYTNCYWIGTTYTCNSMGSGGYSTTRCYTIGNTVHCTQF